MKTIYGFVLVFMSLFAFSKVTQAQTNCAGISAGVFSTDPDNIYYGVRVTLNQAYEQSITVSGNIISGDPNVSPVAFSLTVSPGNLTQETQPSYYQTSPGTYASAVISTITPSNVTKNGVNYSTQCNISGEITGTYAGVSIVYESSNNILRFNSLQDVNTVLDQLDADYDNHNDTYDNQYPNLTADQLDDMDAQTGFDQFKPFRDFENLFSGFSTKRAEIENTEITWLNNNFGGLDPDDVDLTFDDAENTIFNGNYSFKVGNDIYQLTSTGLYINGTLQASKIHKGEGSSIASERILQNGIFKNASYSVPGHSTLNYGDIYSTAVYINNNSNAEILAPGCSTNKKLKSPPYQPSGTERRFELKVAINSIGVRSSIKGKIVHFKYKNGKPKRARAEMAVGCQGYVYNTACISLGQKSKSKPETGYKKRSELKAKDWQVGTIWKTLSGEVSGSFATPEGYGAALPLTW